MAMLVIAFDPSDKSQPYYDRGKVTEIKKGPFGPYRNVLNKAGERIIRVEFFHDRQSLRLRGSESSSCWRKFQARCDRLYDELETFDAKALPHEPTHTIIYGDSQDGKSTMAATWPALPTKGWDTVVLDSLTYAILAAKNFESQVQNPGANTQDQARYAADAVERLVQGGFAFLPCNVVIIAHTSKGEVEFGGVSKLTLQSPGRTAKGVPTGYGEVYHTFLKPIDKEGETRYVPRVQTRSDSTYFAGSVTIKAPNPCRPTYDALWEKRPPGKRS